MKNRFVAVLALVVLAFASVSMAAENLSQEEVDKIVKGVENGDADAQLRLGMMYVMGQNVKQNNEQAEYWLKKSYEQGNVEAQFFLAFMYADGHGVEKDEAQAFKLMKQIAKKDPSTIKKVYGFEIGSQKIYSSAEEFVAAAQGFVGSVYYEGGKDIQKDYEQAEYWLKKSLENSSEIVKKETQSTLEKIRARKAKQSQTSAASTQPKPQTQPSASDSVMEIEVKTLLEEYNENKFAVKQKYVGKRIRVIENISSIDNDDNGEVYVTLVNRQDLFGFICRFDRSEINSVMRLKTGQRVIIEGKLQENRDNFIYPLSLHHCSVIGEAVKTESTKIEIDNNELPIEVGALQFVKEYRENDLAAKRRYDGKKIRISGVVHELGVNESDFRSKIQGIYFMLAETKNSWDWLYCYFDKSNEDEAMQLKIGQKVTIEGIGTSAINIIHCRVVNASQSASRTSAPSASTVNTQTIEIDEAVKEFLQRENIPYSIAAIGDIYLLRSYMSQFKAINGDTAYIYSEPDTSSRAVLKLDKGAKLIADAEYTGNDGSDWYYVHFGDSARGWVLSQYITDRDPDDNSDNSSETSESSETNSPLSDAEYTQMLKNPDFAKADKSLNAAWSNARKLMKTKDFEALKQEQSKWISGGRDAEARERMNENMEEKTQAYATVTLARAYYVAHLARGERLMYAIPTGNRVNVRSKPVNGKVLYQVSNDYGDGEGDLLIVDGNPVNGNGENWYKVLYTVSVNEGAAVKANGFIVGRFIRLEPLPILDWRYADN